jgi:pimeloyl-ACP methyl ester carboxylesterase
VVHWESHPVEILRLPAPTPRHTALVLPGNPGVAAWYSDFAVALREQLPDDVEVVVCGFAGHYSSPALSTPQRCFVLDEQMSCMAALLASLPATQSVVLVGHSIGAYVALQLLRANSAALTGVVGLYPFLRYDGHSQRILSWLVACRPLVELVASVSALLGRLPKSLLLALLQPFFALLGGLGAGAQRITAAWLRPASIRNVCVLGASEFAALAREPDWNLVADARVRLFYGPPDDMWAPSADADEAESRGAVVARDASFGHMFCVSEDGSRHVAAVTSRLITDLIESRR